MEWNYDKSLYKILSSVHRKCQFSEFEIGRIFEMFLNLSTNSGFYHVVERGILPQHETDLKIKKKLLQEAELISLSTYVTITANFQITLILKMLFEWNLNSDLKYIYLFLLREMVQDSLTNAAVCGKVL